MVEQKLARRFFISGMVQGVGYRFFAQDVAARLGVAGFVRNLSDGRVEVYAIGNAGQLDALQSELRRGPRMASVSDVSSSDSAILPQYAGDFVIEQSD